MELVTTFWLCTTTGSGETGFHTGVLREGVDSNLKFGAFVDHDKITFEPSFWIFRVNPAMVILLISKLFAVSSGPLEVPSHKRKSTQVIGRPAGLSVPACV